MFIEHILCARQIHSVNISSLLIGPNFLGWPKEDYLYLSLLLVYQPWCV